MSAVEILDVAWLRRNPLPMPEGGSDKNARGRVLAVGGAEFVPGALRLTGEAALRAGAGKLRMATVASAALPLGVLVPEAAMIALPAQENGEIAQDAGDALTSHVGRSDAMIIGPGMSVSDGADRLVATLMSAMKAPTAVVLDAAALTSARDLEPLIARHDGRVILTPHHGEMAALTGEDEEAIGADPQVAAVRVARRFRAIVVLKSQNSVIADPQGRCLSFEGGCVGLATGGSGDVLAGIIGGLAARGADPMVAAAWGSWAHGRAGRLLADRVGPIGFLAREILPLIPTLLHEGVEN